MYIAGLMLGCSSSDHSDLFDMAGSGSGGSAGAGAGGAKSGATSGSSTTTGISGTGTGSGSTTATGSGAGGTGGTGATTGGRGGSGGTGNAGASGAPAGSGGTGMAGTTGTAGAAGNTSAGGAAGRGGTGGAGPGGGTSMGGASGGVNTGGSAGLGGMGGSGGGPGDIGATCGNGNGCKQGLYCKKAGCMPVDLPGQCAARPTQCAFADSPICGCDGFTYLNACIAEMNGQNVATQVGACKDGVAVRCMPGDKTCEIRPNGVCGVIIADHNACASMTITGKCWVIPAECVPTGTHYDSCDGAGKCIHTCDVVKDQRPYYPAPDFACQ
jgi:hypothetical protein